MPRLILIKHASPQVEPAIDSAKWHLSARGREQCEALADRIAIHRPREIISSDEPKAIETAELIAKKLSLPHRSDHRLAEHDRSNVPHLQSREFISMMELFFRRPEELVLGRETASAAQARFESALEEILASNASKNIALVAHGTVLALFLEKYLGQSAFSIWREMGLPSMVILELPGFGLIEKVSRI